MKKMVLRDYFLCLTLIGEVPIVLHQKSSVILKYPIMAVYPHSKKRVFQDCWISLENTIQTFLSPSQQDGEKREFLQRLAPIKVKKPLLPRTPSN